MALDATPTGLTVVAVGDLQLGDSPTAVGFGFYSRYRGRPIGALFTDVTDDLRSADVAFGNLECTLSRDGVVESSWRSVHLRGEPAFAPQLKAAGFTVLNVANNHAVQHGARTFTDTLAQLRAAGIAPLGVRGTDGWNSEPVLVTAKSGLRAGLLGYCLRPRQYDGEVPPYAEGTTAAICADVARLRPTVDRVLVSLHWGEEFVDQPSQDEVAMAHAILDAGASLIIGHHPHVVRPVERHGAGVVAYSLGNFVADMVWQDRLRRGAVLRCAVPASGAPAVDVRGTHIGADFRPAITGPLAIGAANGNAGLNAADYQRAINETVSAQQWAGYRHALRNIWRFPPAIVAQLLVRTVRNKVIRLVYRLKGKPLPF